MPALLGFSYFDVMPVTLALYDGLGRLTMCSLIVTSNGSKVVFPPYLATTKLIFDYV